MKGDFSRSTFSTRKRYGSVTLQEGRVQLDTDWNEKSELQINGGLVYLDVWEREIHGTGDPSLGSAAGGPADDQRSRDLAAESYGVRMVRQTSLDGHISTTLHASLGRAGSSKAESFTLPDLEVSVEGVVWRRVNSFSGYGSKDQVYVLTGEGNGSSIGFGDGKHGAIPDAGSRIVASYRFGAGGPSEPGRRKPKARTRG